MDNTNEMSMLADQFRRESGMRRTFKKGDKDNLVHLLQTGLYRNGYNLHLNGSYDDATEAAVRAYQCDHGFAENGIAGPDMLAALFPDPPAAAARSMPAARPAPAARPVPAARPAPPARPMPLPAPAPGPANQARPRPQEYNIRLNGRNPQAIIRVSYDG